MKPVSLLELAARFGADLVGENGEVTHFATDSRETHRGSLFIAIAGENVDGHEYAEKARAQGAVASLVERPVAGTYLLVPIVVGALANLGRSYRQEFTGPVIGITGSAGKTTTKEMVSAAVAPLGPVLATVGNRNTEFTAPLLWPESNDGSYAAAVIEMGMRGLGQIAHLAAFSLPEIGIITNIGWSHLSMVGTRLGIAQAKAELFEAIPRTGLAIAPHEDDYLDFLKSRAPCEVATFGFEAGSTAQVIGVQPLPEWRSRGEIRIGGESYFVEVPGGRHVVLNAAAALLAARRAGVPSKAAAEALGNMKMPPMRNDIRRRGDQTWVLDMYNSAPNSVTVSLEMVAERAHSRPIVAVLGEMRELGDETIAQHRALGELCVRLGVSMLIGLDSAATVAGPDGLRPARAMVESARGIEAHYAQDHAEVRQLLESIPPDAIVLVKGSRAVALETVVPAEVLALG